MRVMVLATHPELAPSTRFRVHQYRNALAKRGIELQYRFLFDQSEYRRLRASKNPLGKGAALLRALRERQAILEGSIEADLVWVQREIAPTLQAPLIDRLARIDAPVLFDFDDAVFLPRPGGNSVLRMMSNPDDATARLCRLAAVVQPGNEFLADFAYEARGGPGVARRSDPAIRMLPTVIDTDRFVPGPRATGTPIVGWVGSHTTLQFLLDRAEAFQMLRERMDFVLRIVSNRPPPPIPGVAVEYVEWHPDSEVEAFHGLSVGVYPLRDDHWARGKCGFKAIEYSSCEVPVVASPVGVVRDIVVPEETGLWAESDEEWCEALERTLRDPEAGERWGRQGRALIQDHYSLSAALPRLESSIREAVGRPLDEPQRDEEEPCVASPVS